MIMQVVSDVLVSVSVESRASDSPRWKLLVGKRVGYVRDNVMTASADARAILMTILVDASEAVSFALFRGAGQRSSRPLLYDLVSERLRCMYVAGEPPQSESSYVPCLSHAYHAWWSRLLFVAAVMSGSARRYRLANFWGHSLLDGIRCCS